MISVTYSQSSFSEEFNQILSRATRPRAVLMAAGRELSNRLRSHFRAKDREEPNALSPRRQHFWLQVAMSVGNPEQTGYNAVSVRVSDPRIAQKVFGGPIVAKKAKALTIPVEERAYGRTARTFEAETGLKLILVKTGKGNFANAVLGVREGSNKYLTVEYVLKPSVMQEKDPTALPDEAELLAAILDRSQKVLDRQIKGDAQ